MSVRMRKRLKDKVIVITGGTKGLGKGIARLVADEGARVVIGGRNEEDGRNAVQEIQQAYRTDAVFVQGDISITENCRRLMDEAMNRFGRIDGLVNNAGIFPRATLLDTEEILFDQIFNVNIKSAFFCSKYAVEAMMKQGGGSIVHMGSTHGYKGGERLAAYACSKGALHTLSKHIAHNYAQYGIRSNWVTVGWVATEGEMEQYRREGKDAADLDRDAKLEIPSGRLQSVEETAYGVIYLLSDESTQVTATDLHITGAFNV